MKMSKETYDYRNAYIAENYKQIGIKYPIDFVAEVQTAAKQQGQSIAAYIRQAIEDRMAKDGFNQSSASTKFVFDEDGNRIMVEYTANGMTLKRLEKGWINVNTGEVFPNYLVARESIKK